MRGSLFGQGNLAVFVFFILGSGAHCSCLWAPMNSEMGYKDMPSGDVMRTNLDRNQKWTVTEPSVVGDVL